MFIHVARLRYQTSLVNYWRGKDILISRDVLVIPKTWKANLMMSFLMTLQLSWKRGGNEMWTHLGAQNSWHPLTCNEQVSVTINAPTSALIIAYEITDLLLIMWDIFVTNYLSKNIIHNIFWHFDLTFSLHAGPHRAHQALMYYYHFKPHLSCLCLCVTLIPKSGPHTGVLIWQVCLSPYICP